MNCRKMWTDMAYKNEINLNLKWAIRYETLKTKWLHSPDKWLLLSFSCSVTFDSVTPWIAAHQASCPSLSPGVCSNWCPLSQWCHSTISSSVTHFSSCPQSVLASGPFPMSWFLVSGSSPWGCWGSDTTERLCFDFSLLCIGEGSGNSLQCSCLENPRDGGAWCAAV